jgi:hypothetical protein
MEQKVSTTPKAIKRFSERCLGAVSPGDRNTFTVGKPVAQ